MRSRSRSRLLCLSLSAFVTGGLFAPSSAFAETTLDGTGGEVTVPASFSPAGTSDLAETNLRVDLIVDSPGTQNDIIKLNQNVSKTGNNWFMDHLGDGTADEYIATDVGTWEIVVEGLINGNWIVLIDRQGTLAPP